MCRLLREAVRRWVGVWLLGACEVKHAVVSTRHADRVSDRQLAARADAITGAVVFLFPWLQRLISGHIGSGRSGSS